MVGGILALVSAICFGFNNASVRRGVLKGTVLQALAITVPLGVPFFLIVIIATGNISALTGLQTDTFLWLAAAGVVHFVMGRYCNYRSTKAIGGNLSGPWTQSNLILALVLAIVFLDEVLTPLKAAGILLIVAGAYFTSRATFAKKKATPSPATAKSPSITGFSPAVAAVNGADTEAAHSIADSVSSSSASGNDKVNKTDKTNNTDKTDKAEDAFEPNYVEGYSFALVAALAYGSSPILIRLGVENQTPGTSIAGALVSYTAAAIVIGLILCLPGNFRHARAVDRSVVKWFSLAAVLVAISQMFRYLALSIAPVSVVTPIQSTSAIFRVLFGWLINRKTEVFGAWVFIGVFVSMAGVVLLSLSTSLVTAHLPLPTGLVEWLNLSWPHS